MKKFPKFVGRLGLVTLKFCHGELCGQQFIVNFLRVEGLCGLIVGHT